MNLGITIARKKGGKWEVVTDPNTPFPQQRREFRDICEAVSKTHDEVQLVSTSMGKVKRKRIVDGGRVTPANELTAPASSEAKQVGQTDESLI